MPSLGIHTPQDIVSFLMLGAYLKALIIFGQFNVTHQASLGSFRTLCGTLWDWDCLGLFETFLDSMGLSEGLSGTV